MFHNFFKNRSISCCTLPLSFWRPYNDYKSGGSPRNGYADRHRAKTFDDVLSQIFPADEEQ